MNNIDRKQAVENVKNAAAQRVNVLRQYAAIKAAYRDLTERMRNCRMRASLYYSPLYALLIPGCGPALHEQITAEKMALKDEAISLDLRAAALETMKVNAQNNLHQAVEAISNLNTGDMMADLEAEVEALGILEQMNRDEKAIAAAYV